VLTLADEFISPITVFGPPIGPTLFPFIWTSDDPTGRWGRFEPQSFLAQGVNRRRTPLQLPVATPYGGKDS
jgi:hypothetical protein